MKGCSLVHSNSKTDAFPNEKLSSIGLNSIHQVKQKCRVIKSTLLAIINGHHNFASQNQWKDCKELFSPLYQQKSIDPIFHIKSRQFWEWINRRKRRWRNWLVNNQKVSFLVSQLWIISTSSLSLPHPHTYTISKSLQMVWSDTGPLKIKRTIKNIA